MTQTLNLKELERLAFRRTFQDGLYEIYLGGLFASFAAFGFTIFPGNESGSLTTLLYYVVGAGLSGLIFWLGKKFITLPRIGLVTFGPRRQKRKRELVVALLVIVAVQVLVVALQMVTLQFPAVREWLAAILGSANHNNLRIAIFAAIFVTPGMLLIAYKMEIPGGYYHAVTIVLAVFLMILLDQAWWMVLGGVLIMLPGVAHFIQFIQRYPLEKTYDERP